MNTIYNPPKPKYKIASGNYSSKVPFSNIYMNHKFKYIITQGNNSKLIREAFKRRKWWIEIQNMNNQFNFKWSPVSGGIKFRELETTQSIKQIVNHFECHRHLSNKNKMFENVKTYWENIKENVFKIIPLTFFISVDVTKNNSVIASMSDFINAYNLLEDHKAALKQIWDEYTWSPKTLNLK